MAQLLSRHPSCRYLLSLARYKGEEKMHPLRLIEALRRLSIDKGGVTSIEYAVIASMIIIVCVATITAAGATLNNLFSSVANSM